MTILLQRMWNSLVSKQDKILSFRCQKGEQATVACHWFLLLYGVMAADTVNSECISVNCQKGGVIKFRNVKTSNEVVHK